MFRRFIEHQLSRVRQCPQAGMLGDRVYERLEEALERKVEFIAGSTTTHMVSQAVADNPFATAFPDLITDAERAQALDTIRRQLDSGAMTLPEPLVGMMTERELMLVIDCVKGIDRRLRYNKGLS